MNKEKESQEKRPLFGDWARWTSEPYCRFKSDNIRLAALISRDIRKVIIAIALAAYSTTIPWSVWVAHLLG